MSQVKPSDDVTFDFDSPWFGWQPSFAYSSYLLLWLGVACVSHLLNVHTKKAELVGSHCNAHDFNSIFSPFGLLTCM